MVPNPTAVFIEQDTTTEGNWLGTYGTQGYDVIGDAAGIPSYATVTPSGETTDVWAATTTDPRALETASGIGRIAAAWASATSFTVNVDMTNGQTHILELYFVDWDSTTRSEQVTFSNAATGAVLSTETVSSFHSGVYLEWAATGNLLITITNLSGTSAVLSGLFFDLRSASAVFVRENTTTEGNWIGTYGTQGYDVIDSGTSLPSNITITPAGNALYLWGTANVPQALEVPPSGTTRIAACWYGGSFTVDVNVANGRSYEMELYVLDYEPDDRTESIKLTNAATGTVLSTENVANFEDGAYLNWTISGNVLITITNTGPANAVLSGLFFDPPPPVSTVTTIGSSNNASTYCQSVTFTATVSDASGALPTGSVEFYDGSTELGPGSALSGSGESAELNVYHLELDGGHPFFDYCDLQSGWEFVGSSSSMSQTVSPMALTITATGVNKVYDGTTDATVILSDNRVAGDTFTDTYASALFVNQNVGTAKTVNVSAISVSGPGASNYTFNSTATTTANITQAPLTLTAVTNTKAYDGTTSAAAIPTVSGLMGSDTVKNLTEAYATANVGTGNTLTVATYTVNDGNSGNNYAVTLVPNDTGVITAPPTTVIATQPPPGVFVGNTFGLTVDELDARIRSIPLTTAA